MKLRNTVSVALCCLALSCDFAPSEGTWSEPASVSFCALSADPRMFDRRRVRVRATYSSDNLHYATLTSEACREGTLSAVVAMEDVPDVRLSLDRASLNAFFAAVERDAGARFQLDATGLFVWRRADGPPSPAFILEKIWTFEREDDG